MDEGGISKPSSLKLICGSELISHPTAQHHQPLTGAGESHVEHPRVIAAEITAFCRGEPEVILGFQQVIHT
jgi:hypothetical protein